MVLREFLYAFGFGSSNMETLL